MDQYSHRQWFDYWNQCMALDDTDIPSSCYEGIVEPFRVLWWVQTDL